MASTLEIPDIQGLLISGYKHLPYARYTFLRIDEPRAAGQWLRRLRPFITTAEQKSDHCSVNVAFTHQGLERLGLDGGALGSFPEAFRVALDSDAAEHRRRLLGDVDGSGPGNWVWGAGRPVHVLLMTYWDDPRDREPLLDAWSSHGLSAPHDLMSEPLSSSFDMMREHFGFADGLSQPVLEGTKAGEIHSLHRVKAGEFILGYEDETGSRPETPRVPAASDRDNRLPDVPAHSGFRDLGRNGSYLVARQLAQHVPLFWQYIIARSGTALDHIEAQRLGADLMGRWPDGTVMMENQGDAPAPADNEFGFAPGDPKGFGCPLGSHIRRANPRDTLERRPADSWRTVNRHRLLRRGRPYGRPIADPLIDDGQPRGLLFLCFNADIARQFEFVQGQWLNNPAFGHAHGECDPLIGSRDAGRSLTVQGRHVRRRLTGLPQAVTLKGAAYFFCPGLRALDYLAQLGMENPGR